MQGAVIVSISLYFCHPRPVNGYGAGKGEVVRSERPGSSLYRAGLPSHESLAWGARVSFGGAHLYASETWRGRPTPRPPRRVGPQALHRPLATASRRGRGRIA